MTIGGALRHGVCATLVTFLGPASAQECVPDCDGQSGPPKLQLAADLPIEIDQQALQRQFDAMSTMSVAKVKYSPYGPIAILQGRTGYTAPPDIAERHECEPADDLLATIGTVLLAKGTESLFAGHEKNSTPSTRSRMFTQAIRGMPVINGFVAIEFDTSTHAITKVVARFVPDRGLPEAPRITMRRAEELLPAGWTVGPHLEADSEEPPVGTHLAYYLVGVQQRPILAWAIPVSIEQMPEWAYVNAVTGLVEGHVPSHVHDRVALVSRPCELRR